MSEFATVIVLVEGQTEKKFVDRVLGPYLNNHKVLLTPIILSKSGQKGGDVKFERAKSDIRVHLKQRPLNTTLTNDFNPLENS